MHPGGLHVTEATFTATCRVDRRRQCITQDRRWSIQGNRQDRRGQRSPYYGDFSSPRLKGWTDVLAQHAIVPQQQFAYISGKNASDITLVIDAMDLLHSGRFDGFCLVSSDSDFTRLAARIREQGVDVFGFGEQKRPRVSGTLAFASSTPRTS
jgi:hypothetical protein